MGKEQMEIQRLRKAKLPAGLYERILVRIAREKKHTARIHLAVSGVLVGASAAALVPALQYAAEEISQSGFGEYVSLLFSDGGTLFSSWKDFALLLAESLPAMGMTLVLVASFACMASVGLVFRNVKAAL